MADLVFTAALDDGQVRQGLARTGNSIDAFGKRISATRSSLTRLALPAGLAFGVVKFMEAWAETTRNIAESRMEMDKLQAGFLSSTQRMLGPKLDPRQQLVRNIEDEFQSKREEIEKQRREKMKQIEIRTSPEEFRDPDGNIVFNKVEHTRRWEKYFNDQISNITKIRNAARQKLGADDLGGDGGAGGSEAPASIDPKRRRKGETMRDFQQRRADEVGANRETARESELRILEDRMQKNRVMRDATNDSVLNNLMNEDDPQYQRKLDQIRRLDMQHDGMRQRRDELVRQGMTPEQRARTDELLQKHLEEQKRTNQLLRDLGARYK